MNRSPDFTGEVISRGEVAAPIAVHTFEHLLGFTHIDDISRDSVRVVGVKPSIYFGIRLHDHTEGAG